MPECLYKWPQKSHQYKRWTKKTQKRLIFDVSEAKESVFLTERVVCDNEIDFFDRKIACFETMASCQITN
jgi:hypothetical protein